MPKPRKKTSVSEVTFSVSTVTVSSKGPKKSIRLEVDGRSVAIPVSGEVYAYWHEQFVRKNPTALQSKRFATLMNVLRAAYQKGLSDGNREES